MRLQQKAVLFTLPFILIPTLLLGWLSFRYTQSAQLKIDQSTLQTDVNYRADTLNKYAETSNNTLVYFLNSEGVKKAATQQHARVDLADVRLLLRPHIRTLFDNNKDVIGIRFIGNDLIEFHSQWKDEESTFETAHLLKRYREWFLERKDNELYSVMQTPWFVNDDESHNRLNSIGFVQLISKPDWVQLMKLNGQHDDISFKTLQFLITDTKGSILLAYPQNELGSELPSAVFNRLLTASEQHSISEVSSRSKTISFAGRVVDDQFVVLFGKQKSNIFEADSAYTWISIFTILATIIVSPIILYANFTRLILEPIEQLADAKRQVAQGNLDVKLTEERYDEIGELFTAFNVMVRQLIVYRENEKEGRVKLEYKVKERTEELLASNSALASSNKALETAKTFSEQANELKSAFVANISHEIRTPLTAILGFTEQVLSSELYDPKQKELLQRVLKSGRHLFALINDILDLSKIESNKLDIDVQEIELVETVTDVQSILAQQADAKNLRFDVEYNFPVPKNIRTDETRFRQVLLNLASNAVKFTEVGEVLIKVIFDASKNRLQVTVVDTGIGMSEEVQQRIFNPFVQADVSISRKFGGTGLGLVISKSLVNLLGGDITLRSEIGKGSVFEFYIDIDPDNKGIVPELIKDRAGISAIESKLSDTEQSSVTGPIKGHILIAEDVVDNQHLFALLLEPYEIKIDAVENGQEAVEQALVNDYDLILMDMQMPIMGGIEATQLIRQSGIDTPIYALTANVMQEDIDKQKQAGCNGTISKPIEKAQFLKVIATALSESRALNNDDELLISEDKMAELTRSYMQQLVIQNDIVKKADSSDKIAELKAEMHKIKGSAGSYGFSDLTSIAGELEYHCEKYNSGDIKWSEIDAKRSFIIEYIDKLVSDYV
jgi:signal transduction histidine kinase/DNA-binding NarL/FixJ family response regulator